MTGKMSWCKGGSRGESTSRIKCSTDHRSARLASAIRLVHGSSTIEHGHLCMESRHASLKLMTGTCT